MMRAFIFTDKEREAIEAHLRGEPVDPTFWRVLVHRLKKNNLSILEDVDLMKTILTKLREAEEKKK